MTQRNKAVDTHILAGAFFGALRIDEYGGIGLDSKRPFGNSHLEGSILEIIGATREIADGDWSIAQRDYARILYYDELIPYLREVWESFKHEF